MLFDGHDHLFRSDAELLRGVVDDALVGLVRHEPVDIVGGVAGSLEGILDHVGDHSHGVLEDGAPFHAKVADSLRRGRTAIDIKFGLVAAIRA